MEPSEATQKFKPADFAQFGSILVWPLGKDQGNVVLTFIFVGFFGSFLEVSLEN